MENNEQLNKVLINYFSHETNVEEERSVYEWLQASDENRQYFEKMKDLWKLTIVKQAADKVDINYEWNHFSKTLTGTNAKVVHLNIAEVYENKETETGATIETGSVRKIPYKKIFSGAVAVALLLFLGFQWGWFSGRTSTTPPTLEHALTKPVLHHETNTSGKSSKLVLPDGSEITLANNSEISYEVPFTGVKRHVVLKGKATFKVTKDKSRPFTVQSDDISTTVLGTVFSVDNDSEKDNIVVLLYEGSVLVKSVSTADTKLSHEYILKPGEKLTYNREKAMACVSKWKDDKNARPQTQGEMITGKDIPSMPDHGGNTWFMFNNQPLPDVLEQLKAMYNVKIQYSRRELANMYFIGRFEKTDSLDMMLERIALANSLKMTKTGDKYVIHK